MVTRFGEAAQLSVEAGIAGVEIHAAHGYLLAQFLSPFSNERTDYYGGSPLARAKIVIDVVKAVRKAVATETCVGIKVNSTDHTDLGDSIIQLKAIVDAGVDFVEVSGGSIEDPMFSTGLHTTVKASTKAREAFFIDFANTIRSELPDVPIMLTGGFRTRQGMEAAVKGGSCELVGLARPSVIDPALPKKVLDTSIPDHGALAYAKRIEAWSWAKYTGIKAVGMGAETVRLSFCVTKTDEPIMRLGADLNSHTNATIMEDNNAIVIVGGGCIGLCTAYQLSKSLDDQDRKPSIIVVEAGDRPFAAASSACTGCFHYHFPGPLSKTLTPLGQYSFDLWTQEAQNADFRLATGYRANSSYGIHQGDGKDLDRLPDWIKTETCWDVGTQVLGDNTATVNPNGLGKWLTQQCLARGVKIMTNSEIVGVKLSISNEVKTITLRINGQQKTTIACRQLLLACGPWTPAVYQQLFPSSPVHLQWITDAGDWIICNNPCLTTPESTAFVSFAPLIGEKFEFAGRNDGTIWTCGRRNFDATLPSPGHSDEPDKGLIQEMTECARKWLSLNCTCHEGNCDDVQILSKGRAFRPATRSGLPVISEVKSSDITQKNASLPTGIFVCWGHGSWGLTLGMGSGRVMSQLMRGEKPDIDLSPFSLEQGTIPAGPPSTELFNS
ncbi:NADH oxidase [Fusarium mundagurra]|uniref:NADH oxidase n=1 Tax=Fusarium mundagurra TaxID=1567541 RepID=A0A8H6DBF2_9HYPO|nr:NADH oxidase [Fusarium mundagurra]